MAVAAGLLALIAASPAGAADTAAQGVGLGQVAEVILGLAAVLAVFALVVVLLKRVPGMRGGRGTGMRVVDGLALGARDRVVLLEVGATRLLLGISPGRIACLHVFAGADRPAADFAAQLTDSMQARASAAPAEVRP